MTTVKIRLDEENFTELIQGKIAVLNTESAQVKIILADIGYLRMIEIINKEMKK
jgi:hypothetical protein